jgi:hypothetical protein
MQSWMPCCRLWFQFKPFHDLQRKKLPVHNPRLNIIAAKTWRQTNWLNPSGSSYWPLTHLSILPSTQEVVVPYSFLFFTFNKNTHYVWIYVCIYVCMYIYILYWLLNRSRIWKYIWWIHLDVGNSQRLLNRVQKLGQAADELRRDALHFTRSLLDHLQHWIRIAKNNNYDQSVHKVLKFEGHFQKLHCFA